MLKTLSLATVLFVATAFGIATAAPLGPHPTVNEGGLVTHAKKKAGVGKTSGKMTGKGGHRHSGRGHRHGRNAAGIAGGLLLLETLMCVESGC